jgi:Tetratricopeptide repeat/Glycosyltransferase family 9 (heptosyltransferase)
MIRTFSPPLAPGKLHVPVPMDELLKIAGEFLNSERLDDAERLLTHILSAVPDAAAALHLKGILLFRMNHPQAAAEMVERAVQSAPDAAGFRRNLCPLYERLGRYEDALRIGRQALDANPYDLQTLHNLALVYYRKLQLDDCIAFARRAVAIDPSAPGPHFQLAEALLLRGEFAEGWREYEWRYRIAGAGPALPPNGRPQWNGGPLADGKLLLVADQGYGDVIQFARYIPWVYERCSDVVIAADRILHPLIRQLSSATQLVDRWDRCPSFAAYCPLSGLPRLHGTTLEKIPGDIPYLRAEPERTVHWRTRMQSLIQPNVRRIGIVWAGRPTHNNDPNRSATLASFGPLAELEGTALISLQKGAGQVDIGGYFGRAPLLNLGGEIADFGDSMAIIDELDLIVTVDTAVAHLAGAMGKPVWIVLPYAPDWRWLLGRTDSPWYPSVRLFRQSRAGDWSGVMQQVAEALTGRASAAAA